MLYLHRGWPKTGTTSLQAALAGHRETLARAGFAYPNRWHWSGEDAHNSLATSIFEAEPDADVFDSVLAFIEAHSDANVILSSELLHTELTDRQYEVLIGFFERIREVTPVHSVWALRPIDDVLVSAYTQPDRGRYDPHVLHRFMENFSADRMFARMLESDEALGADVTYVKYDPRGGHAAPLLAALGVPAGEAAAVEREMAAAPRLRPALRQKQLAALSGVDAIADCCGMSVDVPRLQRAFREGFRFDGDTRADPVSGEVRRDLRERALLAANDVGLHCYASFFEHEREPELQPDAPRTAAELAPGDLAGLTAFLCRGPA